MTRAYYNDIDPYVAQWLRNLIAEGLIAPGDVDERSIWDVPPEDLKGYTQAHFFAGIGGWPLALRLAGWPDSRNVWTGSCPCQPFSSAGQRKGFADDRHLWPGWLRLIREHRPAALFGEQVAGAIGQEWFDRVALDLEEDGYAVASSLLPACSVGAPHIRQRLWFVAHSDGGDAGAEGLQRSGEHRCKPQDRGTRRGGMGHAEGQRVRDAAEQEGRHHAGGAGEPGGLADADGAGREGQRVLLLGRRPRQAVPEAAGAGQADLLADADDRRHAGQVLQEAEGRGQPEPRAGREGRDLADPVRRGRHATVAATRARERRTGKALPPRGEARRLEPAALVDEPDEGAEDAQGGGRGLAHASGRGRGEQRREAKPRRDRHADVDIAPGGVAHAGRTGRRGAREDHRGEGGPGLRHGAEGRGKAGGVADPEGVGRKGRKEAEREGAAREQGRDHEVRGEPVGRGGKGRVADADHVRVAAREEGREVRAGAGGRGRQGRVADAAGEGLPKRGRAERQAGVEEARGGAVPGPERRGERGGVGDAPRRARAREPEAREGRQGAAGGPSPWADLEWLPCSDGKQRPTKSKLQYVASRLPTAVAAVRARQCDQQEEEEVDGSTTKARSAEQRPVEFADFVRLLPSAGPLAELCGDIRTAQAVQALLEACGPAGALLRASHATEEVWRPAIDQNQDWLRVVLDEGGWVIGSLFPLATGVPARVAKLRAIGNSIVPQVAAEFIKAVMECEPCDDD